MIPARRRPARFIIIIIIVIIITVIIRVRVNDRKYRGFMIPGPVPVRAGPEPV